MELCSPADQEAQKIKLQNPYGICGGGGSFIDAPNCIGASSSVPRTLPHTSSSPVRPHSRRDRGERPLAQRALLSRHPAQCSPPESRLADDPLPAHPHR